MRGVTRIGGRVEGDRLGRARGRVAHEAIAVGGAQEAEVERGDVGLQPACRTWEVVDDRVQTEVAAAELDRGLLDDLRAPDQPAERAQNDPEARWLSLLRCEVVE